VLAIALQSGSNGNCIYVEAGPGNGAGCVRLLFDAGISGKAAQTRLSARGRDIARADALLISHDHADHARCAGVFSRKFGVPIYVTEPTLEAAEQRCSLGRLGDVRHFRSGRTLRFGDVTVETIPTPHDGADGVAFVVDDGQSRLGILTDLGHVFAGLSDVVRSLDAVILESNYDPEMLAHGPYPDFLKRRIAGPGGHISNFESADLLASAAGRRLRWAALAHLSEHNNTPPVALAAHRSVLGSRIDLHMTGRYEAVALPEV
jgi:phosphoribosyl 1,2-cyclic phosphodiesterase